MPIVGTYNMVSVSRYLSRASITPAFVAAILIPSIALEARDVYARTVSC